MTTVRIRISRWFGRDLRAQRDIDAALERLWRQRVRSNEEARRKAKKI